MWWLDLGKTTLNVAYFNTFSPLVEAKFALSGGKNRLSGGCANHSRPVGAEPCFVRLCT